MSSRSIALVFGLVIALVAAVAGAASPADAGPDADCVVDPGACPVDIDLEGEGDDDSPPSKGTTLLYFWGEGCPHCEEAKPFVAELGRQLPGLTVESIEVRRDGAGRRRFIDVMRRLDAKAVGIPSFVIQNVYIVGYDGDATEARLRDLAERAIRGEKLQQNVRFIDVPMLGRVDPTSISLPTFTLMIGLVDGINPCAMWVLLVLLSILVHVKSRRRLALFGATFVVASGVVYFAFMTAWVGLFSLVGLSRAMTIALGVVVLGLGLVNLKELLWFKKGPSLTIPDKAKPGLYRRMRRISSAASLPAAFLGIAALAFLVNLIELGCTLGLPAVYTRILTLRADLTSWERTAYVALYNVAYVVPLALIVLAYALTLHRITLSERGAKVLKGISGFLLVTFGLLFILAPGVLT